MAGWVGVGLGRVGWVVMDRAVKGWVVVDRAVKGWVVTAMGSAAAEAEAGAGAGEAWGVTGGAGAAAGWGAPAQPATAAAPLHAPHPAHQPPARHACSAGRLRDGCCGGSTRGQHARAVLATSVRRHQTKQRSPPSLPCMRMPHDRQHGDKHEQALPWPMCAAAGLAHWAAVACTRAPQDGQSVSRNFLACPCSCLALGWLLKPCGRGVHAFQARERFPVLATPLQQRSITAMPLVDSARREDAVKACLKCRQRASSSGIMYWLATRAAQHDMELPSRALLGDQATRVTCVCH